MTKNHFYYRRQPQICIFMSRQVNNINNNNWEQTNDLIEQTFSPQIE